jgi:hypothetical protein
VLFGGFVGSFAAGLGVALFTAILEFVGILVYWVRTSFGTKALLVGSVMYVLIHSLEYTS